MLLASRVPAQYDEDRESAWPVWLRGLADFRIAHPGRAPSWRNQQPRERYEVGVQGKTRYGGRFEEDGSLDRVTRYEVSQLALELGADLPLDVALRAQFNLDTDIHGDGDWPLVIEAFLRREWGDWKEGWAGQLGVMNAPFSLEHGGPAWTPAYTLTPSALATWLWEEVRFAGLEAEWWRELPVGIQVDVVAGMGWGPDDMGWAIAERGWVLSDFLSGVNSTLPLPQRGREVSIWQERDERPALYASLTLKDPWRIGQLRLGYLDNLGDEDTRAAWKTRFGTAGVLLKPVGYVDFVFQYLAGEVSTRLNNWDSSFTALYPLLSFHYRQHRLSARYDFYRVHDRDGPTRGTLLPPQLTSEKGDAATLAYFFEFHLPYRFGLDHRVGFEYMIVNSHRPSAQKDPSDNGWQVSYRFRY